MFLLGILEIERIIREGEGRAYAANHGFDG